jgi:hypothetical protein
MHAQLELGHIVPRWAGKWLKDEGYVLGKYDSIGVHTRSQDIDKHYMMCRTCENFLGEAEGYLANVVRGTPDELAARSITLHREGRVLVRLDNVDTALVMRALVGMVFKAHMSPHQMYKHVRLPRWALAEVTAALRQDTYSRDRFCVLPLKIVNLTIPGANPRARINAEMKNFAAGIGTVLRFGGFVVAVHIGAADRFGIDSDMPSFRSGESSMRIGIGEFTYEPGIVPEDVFDTPRNDKGYVPATDPCPCGLARAFGNCCSGRWLATFTRYQDMPSHASRHLNRFWGDQ